MTAARTRRGSAQRGFTLVELLIGITLGLLVVGTVLSVYLGASRGLAHTDRYARMQENGRYALDMLAEDLAMTDFWGRMLATDAISTSLTSPIGDCGADIDVFAPDSAIMVVEHHASPTTSHFTPCTAIEDVRRAGTDLLVLKRVAGQPTAQTFVDVNDADGDGDTAETLTLGASDLQNGSVYLRANAATASLINDASAGNAPALEQQDWLYEPRVYFVRDWFDSAGDGVPTLCRVGLSGLALTDTDCLVQGIEHVHLQFGVDADDDGVPNLYTSQPSTAQIESAVTVRVFVLARSVTEDPFHDDVKSYRLGDVVVPAANDGYYRNVYSTTVTLRNPMNRVLYN